MPWRCVRCKTTHRRNPGECHDCGHTIFDTVSFESLTEEADGIERAEPLKLKRENRVGTTPERSDLGEKGPDVNLDGSIKTTGEADQASEDEDESADGTLLHRFLARIGWGA